MPTEAAELVFDEATKVYPGRDAAAVDHLSLTVPAGEICVLVGPSGGGKTTALKLVNRLIPLTSGYIRIDGRRVRAGIALGGLRELQLHRFAVGGRPRGLGGFG